MTCQNARLWLFGVARRVLANHRRGERRHEQRTMVLREQALTWAGLIG